MLKCLSCTIEAFARGSRKGGYCHRGKAGQEGLSLLPREGDLFRSACYVAAMTKLLEQALRQIEQLPEGEQDAAAGAILDYVKHMRDTRLTDAQVAEVRRRIADPNRKLVSHAEARERIARLGS
jgi:hypothetical protein